MRSSWRSGALAAVSHYSTSVGSSMSVQEGKYFKFTTLTRRQIVI